jgi:hypothetical protein
MDLDAWHDFYVITGGGAAALVGLMFVVISIGPQIGARSRESVRAFVSPTVVFFASVLVIASIMTMPTLGTTARGGALALIGAAGVVLLLRAGIYPQVRDHKLGVEDLVCYLVLPLLAYIAVLGAGVALIVRTHAAPPILGAAVIGLVGVSLRNAWDLVIFTARKTIEEKIEEKTGK